MEAELGIRPNAEAEADFLGYEVKQHRVSALDRVGSAQITLMTPEPTGGSYRENGAEAFVRRYGRAATGGIDRLDFVGVHKVGVRHVQTNLTLALIDFDVATLRIAGEGGRIALIDDDGNEAASWGFTGLMEHWRRKHAHAAYVPCTKAATAPLEYSYGKSVRLARGPDFLKFLAAMAGGSVRYDPGLKVENAGAGRPRTKARSQFRIAAGAIGALYDRVESVNACSHG